MKEKDYPGNFIVVEGADGSGTTTQAEKLAEKLGAFYTYEPSGNKVGEKVDELISSGEYSTEAIALSFAADRMVHLEEEIIPKLKEGRTVVCDRYYHSSLVYQPAAGAGFEWVKKLNKHALTPEITFIMDVSADIGMSRVVERGKDGNIFEDLNFQQEVVQRYRNLEEKLDEDIRIVDASKPIEKVFESVLTELNIEDI